MRSGRFASMWSCSLTDRLRNLEKFGILHWPGINEKGIFLENLEAEMIVSTVNHEERSDGRQGSWFPTTQMPADQDIFALITAFFVWLETVWQLPIAYASQDREAWLKPFVLTKEAYTV